MRPDLVDHWMRAASDPRIDRELRDVLGEAARETERRRPICLASGHCCRFEEYGHHLFVTGLETAWFLLEVRDRRLAAAPADGSAPPADRRIGLPLAGAAASSARSCPWLVDRLCGARSARPLACRLFHCDPQAQPWSSELLERLHGRIRTMHEQFGVVYQYGEWLRMLGAFGEPRQIGESGR